MKKLIPFLAFLFSCAPMLPPKTWEASHKEEKDLCYVVDDIFFSATETSFCPPKAQVREVLDEFYFTVEGSEGLMGSPLVTFVSHDIIMDGGGLATGMSDMRRVLVVQTGSWDITLKHELLHIWLWNNALCGGDPRHNCSPLWSKIDPVRYRSPLEISWRE